MGVMLLHTPRLFRTQGFGRVEKIDQQDNTPNNSILKRVSNPNKHFYCSTLVQRTIWKYFALNATYK